MTKVDINLSKDHTKKEILQRKNIRANIKLYTK